MFEQQEIAGRKSRRRGFTLVELLVVISIMSMLMSISSSGIKQSQRSGPAHALFLQSEGADAGVEFLC